MQYLTIEETNDLLAHTLQDAMHLEVSDDHSGVVDEDEPMRRVLAGLPAFEADDYPPAWRAWDDLVTAAVGRGVTLRRLRIVTEPHSDYVRALHMMTSRNVALGEDIRWLPRHTVATEDYGADEWWLIDDETVAFTLFDSAGDFAGTAVTTDTMTVRRCRMIWDSLWSRAIPHDRYQPGGAE